MPGTPATSPKFGTPRYANADAVDFAGQVNAVTDSLEKAMRLDKGLASARPAASIADRWYYATDTRELSRDTGSAWEVPSTPESAFASGATGPLKGSFSAIRSASISLATGSALVMDAEVYDTSSWYDPTTGRFTPQVAGRFHLSWGSRSRDIQVADVGWSTVLRKNGTAEAVGQQGYQRGSTFKVNSVGATDVTANGTTDFFDIRIDHSAGAATFVLGGSAPDTFFRGHLIGRT